ncbi:MAG: hypothetical protein AAF485_12315 [Chloroflexota bacterium]
MRIAIAWICSLLGLGVTYVILLGHAMSSAPRDLALSTALALIILPLVALIASGVVLYNAVFVQKNEKQVFIYLIPFLLSICSLFNILISLSTPIILIVLFIAGGFGIYKGWQRYSSVK